MKKKTLAKLISVGMVLTMMVSLVTGCGGSNEGGGSGEQVTIRVGSTVGESEPGYEPVMQIIEQFEKDNPDIKVELEVQSSTQYHEKLVSEIAADTLPNVFMHWGGAEMYEAVASGKVLDVTERMNEDSEFMEQFSDAALNSTSVRYTDMEGMWGVPFSMVSGAFYYNKALFEKAGITEVPETWNEFLDCVEKLKAIDVIPIACGAKDGWRVEHLYTAIFLRMNGVEAARKLGSREMKYSDPAVTAAWEEIQKLVDMEAFGPNPASVDLANEQVLVQTGKAAMNFSLSAYMETFTGDSCEVADDIEAFPVPVFEGKEEFANDNFGGGDIALGIATNATDEQIEASWKLCKALSGIEGQTIIANSNALLTANEAIEPDPEKVNRLTPVFTDIISNANDVTTSITNYDSVSTMLTKIRDLATALVNGQITPEQVGQELDAEVEMYSE